MHEIGKEFEFDYGHRVHNQVLNKEYAINDHCKCRHLHGHRAKLTVWLSGELNSEGMVTDFNHLNWLKQLIDNDFDHKFILDIDDPLSENNIRNSWGSNAHKDFKKKFETMFYLTANKLKDYPLLGSIIHDFGWAKEIRDSVVYVPFNPTAENLAMMFFTMIAPKMYGIGVRVSKVEFHETPKSKTVFYNPK